MHITCALLLVYLFLVKGTMLQSKSDTAQCTDLYKETLHRVYYYTSICWTVRSRKVESFRTEMRLLGPTQPMLVPSPPLSFKTTSLSRRSPLVVARGASTTDWYVCT